MSDAIPPIVLEDNPVLLFDANCLFCQKQIKRIVRADRQGRFRLIPLQSQQATDILHWANLNTIDVDSVILVDQQKVSVKSTAVLGVVRYLRFPWPLLLTGWIVPRALRDWLYDQVAARRYKYSQNASDSFEDSTVNQKHFTTEVTAQSADPNEKSINHRGHREH